MLRLLIFMVLSASAVVAQDNFDVEIRFGRHVTHNPGEIEGAYYGLSGVAFSGEKNLTTSSYSLGLCYSFHNSMFKLHVGRHRNGRVLDVTLWDDVFPNPDDTYTGVSSTLNYLQIVPAYVYRIHREKFTIPFELGVAINKRIKEIDIKFIGIKEYNYDIRLSTGVEYNFIKNFNLGLKVVYSKALSNYLDTDYMVGEYYPTQLGLEVSGRYSFAKKIN